MALDIPNNKELFRQRDVREADSGFTAGEGIDISIGKVISGENSTAGNKGIIIVSPGEGIDVSYSDGTATISGEDASTTKKGIASFNPSHFSTSAGVVSAHDDVLLTLDGDSGTATGSSHNIDILGGEGIDTIGSGNDITISGENAGYVNKGIASFNENDFTVTTGAVSLKSKTSYATISGFSFKPEHPATDSYHYLDYGIQSDESSLTFYATIQLPNSATITSVGVYGYGSWNWSLVYVTYGGSNAGMAGAAAGVEDTSISNATIDNSTKTYVLRCTPMDNTDRIYFARITYTTDYT